MTTVIRPLYGICHDHLSIWQRRIDEDMGNWPFHNYLLPWQLKVEVMFPNFREDGCGGGNKLMSLFDSRNGTFLEVLKGWVDANLANVFCNVIQFERNTNTQSSREEDAIAGTSVEADASVATPVARQSQSVARSESPAPMPFNTIVSLRHTYSATGPRRRDTDERVPRSRQGS